MGLGCATLCTFLKMKHLILLLALTAAAHAELRVPAATAYFAPDVNGAKISATKGISGWSNPKITVSWFGEIKTPGKLAAAVSVRLAKGAATRLKLTVAGQSRQADVTGTDESQAVSFGEFNVAKAGYTRFELATLGGSGPDVEALVLDGEVVKDAHFNLDPRRNAASVHLQFPLPKDTKAALFYNEVTAVADPVATYYMACGFSRGYFGMQVNSATERRIIFSVWDAASGQSAKDRTTVAAENHTQLVAKGEGVVASVFGNEGTGGHSHLVYPWKTGSTQRFVVAVKPEGTFTDYSGYWFHPEQKKWMLLATFHAPKDGNYLRGLYSFSENFNGNSGHVPRKALFGPQWIRTAGGEWRELTEARFSHDPTGKVNRLDRFMGVEGGRFFLSHGGFIPGYTEYGTPFTRSATKPPEDIVLP